MKTMAKLTRAEIKRRNKFVFRKIDSVWIFGIKHNDIFETIYCGVNPANGIDVYINEFDEEIKSIGKENE
jgi:hypothetical protein